MNDVGVKNNKGALVLHLVRMNRKISGVSLDFHKKLRTGYLSTTEIDQLAEFYRK